MFDAALLVLALAGSPSPVPTADTRPATDALARATDAPGPRGGLDLDLEGDGRRTLGQLPKNLGRSFVGVLSRDNALPLLLGATVAGTASSLDRRAQWGMGGFAPGFSSAASTAGGSKVMVPAAVGLFAAGRLAGEGSRFRAFTYDATQAFIVNGAYTMALKSLASRTRPDGSDTLSFPSGHTSTAFAWATVARAHYGWKVGAPSYLAATAIGLSRITTDKHHLSDVLAGATIGYVTGRTVVRVNGPARRRSTFALHPAADPAGRGVGLGASFSW
jgi:membrane-associated phospholipid phosphatase